MFILEIRRADANVSINNGGHTQGEVVAIEAAVKDRRRFSDGAGAISTFDSPQGLDRHRSAASRHRFVLRVSSDSNTAVDNTFVQFYPTLFDVAKRLGTVKPTYDPARKP